MMFWWHMATAGLEAYIWQWGTGIGAIIILVGLAFFSEAIPLIGPKLHELRKDLLWVAGGIALFLLGVADGDRLRGNRDAIQQAEVRSAVHAVVTQSKSPAALKRPDKFNSPEN